MTLRRRLLAIGLALLASAAPHRTALAQRSHERAVSDLSTAKPGRDPAQAIDADYTRRILEDTTEKFFLSPLVDYLPASKTVPTPKAVLGDIAGAQGKLPYSKEVYEYMRLLAKSRPAREGLLHRHDRGRARDDRRRGRVGSADRAGSTRTRRDLAKLADPRTIRMDDALADEIVPETTPVYYITGTIHSTEAGAPTALMELAYRLAVDDSAVHPEHPRPRHHADHADRRSRRPRSHGRRLQLAEEASRSDRRRRCSTGATTSRTTTTATRWA